MSRRVADVRRWMFRVRQHRDHCSWLTAYSSRPFATHEWTSWCQCGLSVGHRLLYCVRAAFAHSPEPAMRNAPSRYRPRFASTSRVACSTALASRGTCPAGTVQVFVQVCACTHSRLVICSGCGADCSSAFPPRSSLCLLQQGYGKPTAPGIADDDERLMYSSYHPPLVLKATAAWTSRYGTLGHRIGSAQRMWLPQRGILPWLSQILRWTLVRLLCKLS